MFIFHLSLLPILTLSISNFLSFSPLFLQLVSSYPILFAPTNSNYSTVSSGVGNSNNSNSNANNMDGTRDDLTVPPLNSYQPTQLPGECRECNNVCIPCFSSFILVFSLPAPDHYHPLLPGLPILSLLIGPHLLPLPPYSSMPLFSQLSPPSSSFYYLTTVSSL